MAEHDGFAALAMHVNLVDALLEKGMSEDDAEDVAGAVTQGWINTQENQAEALRDTGREAGRREAERRFGAAAAAPTKPAGNDQDDQLPPPTDQGRAFGRQMAERRFGKPNQ